MLERAKERTAAEFGVVQAVCKRAAQLPLPSAKANLRRGSAPLPALTKQGFGPLFYEWDALPRPIRVEPWSMNLYASSRLWSRMGWSILFTQRSVYQ